MPTWNSEVTSLKVAYISSKQIAAAPYRGLVSIRSSSLWQKDCYSSGDFSTLLLTLPSVAHVAAGVLNFQKLSQCLQKRSNKELLRRWLVCSASQPSEQEPETTPFTTWPQFCLYPNRDTIGHIKSRQNGKDFNKLNQMAYNLSLRSCPYFVQEVHEGISHGILIS